MDEGVSGLLLSRSRVVYVAVLVDGSAVGAIMADCVVGGLGLFDFVPYGVRDEFLALAPEVKDVNVALLHSVAVSPDVQGLGVASALVGEVVDVLFDAGVKTVVSVGWADGDGCHIQGTLERAGFAARGDILGYWTDDSIEKMYECPSCGFSCMCVARIFVLIQD